MTCANPATLTIKNDADTTTLRRRAGLTLVVKRGAQVVLADGVNARVSRLSTGEIELPAGVYGGTGCAVAGAKIRPALFGAGTGSLTVLKGSGSLTLIIR